MHSRKLLNVPNLEPVKNNMNVNKTGKQPLLYLVHKTRHQTASKFQNGDLTPLVGTTNTHFEKDVTKKTQLARDHSLL